MNKEELLLKIREDRPGQTIHEVIQFRELDPGVYDAQVDMDHTIFGFKMRSIMGIVYPRFKYSNVLNLPHYD
jgi:hypothetical protein